MKNHIQLMSWKDCTLLIPHLRAGYKRRVPMMGVWGYKVMITTILILLFTILNCEAMKYQIKYLNTPTITINQKQLTAGDWFNDDAVINWEKDSQAMRVLSEDNKVYTISAKRYKDSKSKKFSDFIAITKLMASRDTHTLIKDLQAIFEKEYEILDELQIDLSEVEDIPEDITILISSTDESIQPLSLTPENGVLTIDRNDIENMLSQDGSISLMVKFVLSDSKEEYLITRWLELIILPKELN